MPSSLIGLSGVAGSGKDTGGNYLSAWFGYQVVHFADRIKAMMRLACPRWDDNHLFGQLKEAIDPHYGFSPRQGMTTLGTEWGRSLNGNLWVMALMDEWGQDARPPTVVCDVRFPNEVQSIQERGGMVIRLLRGEFEVRTRIAKGETVHLSETALLDYRGFNMVIDNSIGNVDSYLENLDGIVRLSR